MNWVETVLVTCGISLDIFALVAKKGAQMSRISKQTLVEVCGVSAFIQTLALCIGILAGRVLYTRDAAMLDHTTEIIATVIFGTLGIVKIVQSRQHSEVTEHLDNRISWRSTLHKMGLLSLSTLVVGIALGFIGTQIILVLLMVVVTIIVVISGFYIGYHHGYQMNAMIYLISGALLLAAAADTVARHIL